MRETPRQSVLPVPDIPPVLALLDLVLMLMIILSSKRRGRVAVHVSGVMVQGNRIYYISLYVMLYKWKGEKDRRRP